MSTPPRPSREGDRGATITSSSCKLRRLAPGGSNGSNREREVGPPWDSLAEDLVEPIGWLVLAGDLLDYVRFRAVCSHWNKSTLRPQGRGLVDPRFHPRRWMMFTEGHRLHPGHTKLGGYVRFFSLATGTFVRVHLPLFNSHVVLESVDGLLLLHRNHDTAIRLLHPFTGDIAELPPLTSLLPQLERYPYMNEDSKFRELNSYLEGVCAAVTVSAAGGITVMLALDMKRRIAHATAGDLLWVLSPFIVPGYLAPTMSSQGKLYALSPKSRNENIVRVWQIDPPQPTTEASHSLSLQPARIIVECPLVAIMARVHLVECRSEVLLIGFSDNSYAHMVVYRLADLINGRVVPITNIGEHALFLGSRALCVTSTKGFPSVTGNTITCNDRLPRYNHFYQVRSHQRPIEHYHLGSGTWSLAISQEYPPVSPYTLIHHIFTCCHRAHWREQSYLMEPKVLRSTEKHLPVISDPEIECAFKDLLGANWNGLPQGLVEEAKKAVSKATDDKVGQEALTNVFHAAEACEELGGTLVTLRMALDDLCGPTLVQLGRVVWSIDGSYERWTGVVWFLGPVFLIDWVNSLFRVIKIQESSSFRRPFKK